MSIKQFFSNLHYGAPRDFALETSCLRPVAWLYGLLVVARLLAYRLGWFKTYSSPVPVISIGNLTTGGTGKTPVVLEIARGLIQSGKSVVILSRGYGAVAPVSYGRALDPRQGDEAYLLQSLLPEAVVIVGKDRVSTLHRAVQEYQPDYVLLDDGFQYLRLQRRLNILLIDGERLVGNGLLLPAGPLREPISQIARADLVFLTKTITQNALKTVQDWVEKVEPKRISGLVGLPEHIPVLPVPFEAKGLQPMNPIQGDTLVSMASIQPRPVLAVSGIAQPDSFEATLKANGLCLLKHFRFADHHVYTRQDVELIRALWRENQAEKPVLITTDKDLPKLRLWLSLLEQESVFTLQMAPLLDGRWFYDEFLTQLPITSELEGHHAQPYSS